MKLINADALKQEIANVMPSRTEVFIVIDEMPDAIVRCKDCRWWHESEMYKGYGDCGQANGITVKSFDWFCADGERQEGR